MRGYDMATESFKRQIVINDKRTIESINSSLQNECKGFFKPLVELPKKNENEKSAFLTRLVKRG